MDEQEVYECKLCHGNEPGRWCSGTGVEFGLLEGGVGGLGLGLGEDPVECFKLRARTAKVRIRYGSRQAVCA